MKLNTSKISISAGVTLIAFAFFFDAVQFLLDLIAIGFILDPVLAVIAQIILGIAFSRLGMSMFSPKRSLRTLATFLGELIPGADALPIFTGSIGYTVFEEWRRPDDI